jgi:hypothetical protein
VKNPLEKKRENKITVHVKYGDIEQTFDGSVNDVWVGINKFFSETVPAFDLARKITLSVDLPKLIEDFKDVVAITPEGPQLLVSRKALTDSETLLLNLLAAHVGYRLGKLEREWLTREELQAKLGKSMKITSTRLGELTREGMALRTDEGNYKITTFGIKKLQEASSKIRTKL